MGIFSSSSEESSVETKTVDSNGNINNNIILQEAQDVHSQLLSNEKLLIATYALVFAEILKISVYLFHTLRRKIKKRYQAPNA